MASSASRRGAESPYVSIVLGTRPEIIKMAPLIKECEARDLDYFVIHTGQHYNHDLDGVFFDELGLPQPKYNLGVGSNSHARTTANIMVGIEDILTAEEPDVILVQGDTNSVLAGAITASKLPTKIGHVEAGLRSYDRSMPEEVNRKLTDDISDYLFCPTDNERQNLLNEGIDESKIHVTGNTIADSIAQNLAIARAHCQYDVPDNYFVLTLHRQENVDNKNRFLSMLQGVDDVYKECGKTILFPAHPRTVARMSSYGVAVPAGVEVVAPLGYLDFLYMLGNAELVMTDSGGIQEETCIMNVPCVTLRDNTERPETVYVGGNILAGSNPNRILTCTMDMLNRTPDWSHPYGVNVSQNIVDIIQGD